MLNPKNQGTLNEQEWRVCCQKLWKAGVKVSEDCAITMLRRAVMTMDPSAFVTALAWVPRPTSRVPQPSSVAGQMFDPTAPRLADLQTTESVKSTVLLQCGLWDLLVTMMRAGGIEAESSRRRMAAIAVLLTDPAFLGKAEALSGEQVHGPASWVVHVFGTVASLLTVLPHVRVADTMKTLRALRSNLGGCLLYTSPSPRD